MGLSRMEMTGVDSSSTYKRCQGGTRESRRKRRENEIKAERGEKKGWDKGKMEWRKTERKGDKSSRTGWMEGRN